MNRNTIVYSKWTFTDDNIHSGNMYLAMALMSDALEANTFTAKVECADRSIINFERNTPLTYSYKGQQRGIFYVQSITRDGPTTYTISATSAIGLLIESLHYGGIYTGQTVAEVLPSICGTVPYVVKTNLRDIALYGWLPVASSRDNLSQVLFAIGASIRTDLDGVLHIETLWDGIVGNIGKDRLYNGARVNYDAKVTQVVVTEHQYMEGGDEESLFEGTAAEGDIITFDDPMYDLTPSGLTILESGANYAKVSAGTGTLTGRKYIHNTREVARAVSQANEPNVITVTNATLVSLVNSVAVAERLVNYYQWTETIESGVVYDGELPGNRSNAWHPYDEEVVSGCLESADVNLSNTLKAEERLLVGYVPPKFEQVVTYDEHELLTGSGNWIVPEGVTEVRLVLIQGGQAGYSGESGTGGGGSSIQNTDTNRTTVPSPSTGKTVNVSASASRSGASAGKGGSGGQGGSGGKVLQSTIEVTPGQTIAYACGNGGTSGGVSGGETTFGALSSAGGGTLPSGYTDIVTGITYAISGADGGDGSDGGANGASGGNAGNVSGGTGIASRSWNRTGRNSSTGVTTSATYSFNHGGMGGGGAGGPSGRNNGAVGKNAVFGGETYTSNGYMTGSASLKQNFGGAGGAGADGSNGSTYGSGGSGGGGGGGGGAAGNASVNTSVSSTFSREVTGSVSATATVSPPRAGAGGAGGSGGSGAAGCILLYYGVKEKIASGPIKTSNGKIFLDKFNRLMVV